MINDYNYLVKLSGTISTQTYNTHGSVHLILENGDQFETSHNYSYADKLHQFIKKYD
jgi:hypothetical protein